jgi:hypothetical protein
MNLNEIKQAVQHLSSEDFKTFEAWFDKVQTENGLRVLGLIRKLVS